MQRSIRLFQIQQIRENRKRLHTDENIGATDGRMLINSVSRSHCGAKLDSDTELYNNKE